MNVADSEWNSLYVGGFGRMRVKVAVACVSAWRALPFIIPPTIAASQKRERSREPADGTHWQFTSHGPLARLSMKGGI